MSEEKTMEQMLLEAETTQTKTEILLEQQEKNPKIGLSPQEINLLHLLMISQLGTPSQKGAVSRVLNSLKEDFSMAGPPIQGIISSAENRALRSPERTIRDLLGVAPQPDEYPQAEGIEATFTGRLRPVVTGGAATVADFGADF